MKRQTWIVLVLAGWAVLFPGVAQAHDLLSELLLKVLLSDIVLAPPTAGAGGGGGGGGGGGFQSHEAHFRPILNTGEVASGFQVNQLEVPLTINSIIAAQLATIPLGSSSGGFSYTFNPSLGTFTRQSSTFGSAFAERALTAGRGRFNIGFNFQRATYDTLEGADLDNGDVRVYLVHQDCCAPENTAGAPPAPFFEGDIIENRLSLNLTSSIFSAFVNYGVTDRLDVGVIVPAVTVRMKAAAHATVLRLATADTPGIHSFPGRRVGRDRQRVELRSGHRGHPSASEVPLLHGGRRRAGCRCGPAAADRRLGTASRHGRGAAQSGPHRIDGVRPVFAPRERRLHLQPRQRRRRCRACHAARARRVQLRGRLRHRGRVADDDLGRRHGTHAARPGTARPGGEAIPVRDTAPACSAPPPSRNSRAGPAI